MRAEIFCSSVLCVCGEKVERLNSVNLRESSLTKVELLVHKCEMSWPFRSSLGVNPSCHVGKSSYSLQML
ncbi:60S ribosomal protein l9 [Corchorus olitorius]|uniref:60S ribosomal protein l9 n=1 Tax=Corchorus olitorius TaxID=93759 RepID=A0A1R3GY40_9ROSI|nr:60S ribosomal protein l9 [Corchorus olitorius]